jgi:RNA 2',3'-cyclic 3'-phosphodiesterase
VRLFVAFDLEAEAADALLGWAHRALARDRAMRVVGELHLTLCFLGTRTPGEADAVADVLARAVEAGPWPEDLETAGALWLPERRPNVLTVEVADPSGALAALAGRVGAAVAGVTSWEPERRHFRPHVTVARLRRGTVPRTYDLPAPPRVALAGTGVALVSSVLAATGARHEALEVVERPGA